MDQPVDNTSPDAPWGADAVGLAGESAFRTPDPMLKRSEKAFRKLYLKVSKDADSGSPTPPTATINGGDRIQNEHVLDGAPGDSFEIKRHGKVVARVVMAVRCIATRSLCLSYYHGDEIEIQFGGGRPTGLTGFTKGMTYSYAHATNFEAYPAPSGEAYVAVDFEAPSSEMARRAAKR